MTGTCGGKVWGNIAGLVCPPKVPRRAQCHERATTHGKGPNTQKRIGALLGWLSAATSRPRGPRRIQAATTGARPY